jgi:Ran GTPase-activating protein (RanGAP) involved in mRNA processing and transport
LESTPGEDTRPAVARAIVNAGYDLLEMKPVGMSLEDIFLQLTRDELAPIQSASEDEDQEEDENEYEYEDEEEEDLDA